MARGRPRIEPGTWGEITVKQLAPKRYQAWVTAVTPLGVQRVHRPIAETKGAARDAAQEMARATTSDGTDVDSTLDADSTVEVFLRHYIDHRDGELSASTLKTYRSAIDRHIVPSMGQLPLRAVTTPRIDSWLKTHTAGTAKTCRALLSGAFSQAVRWGLVTVNPVRETSKPKSQRKEIETLTVEQLGQWLERVTDYQQAEIPGPGGRAEPLARMVAVLAGTGARPAEMLTMRWEDLHLDESPPNVLLRGTKTEHAERTIIVPDSVVQALNQQRAAIGAMAELHPWVWPTSTGTHVSMSSLERWFRHVRKHWSDTHPNEKDPLPHVTPYVFRRTVATIIADQVGEYEASVHLGHSDTSVTRRHYISRRRIGPDVSQVLGRSGSAGEMQE